MTWFICCYLSIATRSKEIHNYVVDHLLLLHVVRKQALVTYGFVQQSFQSVEEETILPYVIVLRRLRLSHCLLYLMQPNIPTFLLPSYWIASQTFSMLLQQWVNRSLEASAPTKTFALACTFQALIWCSCYSHIWFRSSSCVILLQYRSLQGFQFFLSCSCSYVVL